MTEERNAARIQSMFDRISPHYDLLNRIISLGLDMKWRQKAVALLGDLRGGSVLDLCCGSGDFLHILTRKFGSEVNLYGFDFSPRMLSLARGRLDSAANNRLILSRADAMAIPLADECIRAITIGFGIRNVADRDVALRETYRILQPGGRLVMIEPASPSNPVVRFLFSTYFKYLAPLIGGLISGDLSAYKYLHDSAAAFPTPDEFLNQMKAAGYSTVRAYPQTMGTAMIYFGEK